MKLRLLAVFLVLGAIYAPWALAFCGKLWPSVIAMLVAMIVGLLGIIAALESDQATPRGGE